MQISVLIAQPCTGNILLRRANPMPNPLKSLFMAHPDALNETYGQHLRHAMSYSGRLFAASFCAFVHGLLPFLFEKTASNEIKRMHAEMMARGAMTPEPARPQVLPAE
jgi:Family of unknown function (DUF6356)